MGRSSKETKMGFSIKIPFTFIQLLVIIHANAENSAIHSINSESELSNKTEEIKIGYGCNPPSDWQLLYPTISSQEKHQVKDEHVKNVCLEKSYDPAAPPEEHYIVDISLEGTSLKEIDAVNLLFFKVTEAAKRIKKVVEIDLRLLVKWRDQRIKPSFGETTTTLKLPSVTRERKSMIWTPTFEVENLVTAGKKILKLMNLENRTDASNDTLHDDFLVRMDVKSSVVVNCNFDVSRYPFDKHFCQLRVSLDGIDNENMIPATLQKAPQKYPTGGFVIVQILKGLSFEYSEEHGQNKSYVGVNIHMFRNWRPVLFQQFILTFAIVIASGFSFAIPYSALSGRIGFELALFLALALFFTNQMYQTPGGQNFNALGAYQLASLLFVLGTLIETVIVVLVRLRFEWKTYGIYDAPNGLRMVLRLMNQEKITNQGRLKICPDEESIASAKRRQEILGQETDREDTMIPEVWKRLREGQMEQTKLPRFVKMDIFAFIVFNISYVAYNLYYWKIQYK